MSLDGPLPPSSTSGQHGSYQGDKLPAPPGALIFTLRKLDRPSAALSCDGRSSISCPHGRRTLLCARKSWSTIRRGCTNFDLLRRVPHWSMRLATLVGGTLELERTARGNDLYPVGSFARNGASLSRKNSKLRNSPAYVAANVHSSILALSGG
jgi:hypothetical protein